MENNSKAVIAAKKRVGYFNKVRPNNTGKRPQEAGSIKLIKSDTDKKKANSKTVRNKRRTVKHKGLKLVAQEKYPEFSESIKRKFR